MPDLPQTLSQVKWQLREVTFDDPAAAYGTGFVGAYADPEGLERLGDNVMKAGGMWEASDVCGAYGMMEQGKGKLCSIAHEIMKAFGPDACCAVKGQITGDCVSHGLRTAILGTLSTAINHGLSGRPITTPEGIQHGVLASEPTWWLRGYNGDGWSCPESLDMAMQGIGAVSRRPFTEIGMDFTKYPTEIKRYGSHHPPEEVMKALGGHKVETVTKAKSFEEVRDLIASGFALQTCGGEGFATTRDEHGVAKRSGHWAHSMAVTAADDRDEVKKLYGGPLLLFQNSWGRNWQGGGRKIIGTTLEIPPGCFWAKWSDVSSRFYSAIATVARWEPRKLPDLGLGDLI